jgi:sterol desaturase/sphingolipid hydroxylase (fatty acid hydroxylase superfamily)
MQGTSLPSEPLIRLAAFAAVFALMALWEARAPRRRTDPGRRLRWPGNLGLVLINTIALRLLLPITAIGAALAAGSTGWGLLHLWPVSPWLAFPVTILVLDLAIYAQHVLFHAVPALWRLHRMHHADLGFDVSTGLRFHPGEILLSALWKIAVVAALGAPPIAVLAFEVLLNATAMFNHANIGLGRLDRQLRWLLVTPDMHRIHHSVIRQETDSNFGFNLPWWDRLFRTYRARPEAGQLGMTIGLPEFRRPAESRLDRLLTQPFRSPSPPP